MLELVLQVDEEEGVLLLEGSDDEGEERPDLPKAASPAKPYLTNREPKSYRGRRCAPLRGSSIK